MIPKFKNCCRVLQSAAQLYRSFSVAEIRAASNNLNDNLMVGEGSFCRVYKGRINKGTLEVAVRRLKAQASLDELYAEIEAQSQLRHLHIMSLIGYCVKKDVQMLVYNYMANGSLGDDLYGIERGYEPLPWKRRLEICIGAAQGLLYLHSGTSITIVHCDIKPSKIMLDESWVAKVAHFGSRVVPTQVCRVGSTEVTTQVCSTLGYLDPEYIHTSKLTEKSNVYSFGMVLLEVLCAKRPIELARVQDQTNLAVWFVSSVQEKTIDEIIDPYLVGKIAPECLWVFVNVVRHCLMLQSSKRPSMNDVVESLQLALKLQKTWHSDIEFGGASHDDNPEVWLSAYNNVLSDSAFGIIDTRSNWETFSSTSYSD